MVVVMIVPVAIGVPAMAVFIPPFMIPAPATLAGLMQLMARTVRLFAVPAMMLTSFVELVIGFGNVMLAIIVIGNSARSSSKEQESAQNGRGHRSFPKQLDISRQKSLHLIPPVSTQREASAFMIAIWMTVAPIPVLVLVHLFVSASCFEVEEDKRRCGTWAEGQYTAF
jgi:hypothetical protein